jgi:hypothetical protein
VPCLSSTDSIVGLYKLLRILISSARFFPLLGAVEFLIMCSVFETGTAQEITQVIRHHLQRDITDAGLSEFLCRVTLHLIRSKLDSLSHHHCAFHYFDEISNCPLHQGGGEGNLRLRQVENLLDVMFLEVQKLQMLFVTNFLQPVSCLYEGSSVIGIYDMWSSTSSY